MDRQRLPSRQQRGRDVVDLLGRAAGGTVEKPSGDGDPHFADGCHGLGSVHRFATDPAVSAGG